MMKEIEVLKQAAEQQMVQQKTDYEEKLRTLEDNLVSGCGLAMGVVRA